MKILRISCMFGGFLSLVLSMSAQTLTTLYSFDGTDGANPYAGLVQATNGKLYGTTQQGGSSGYGTVFKVSKGGKETVLYSFTGGSSDGAYPLAQLIRDSAGSLYGTTYEGGSSGYGTVFKVSKTGKETVLHKFAGGSSDGCNPAGGLVQDKAGNLYGTTEGCGASGYGTVFAVSKSGKETVLHSFGMVDEGGSPYLTSLLMDANGNLYGVTPISIRWMDPPLPGTLYELSKNGTFTVLEDLFFGCSGTLAMDKNGDLYGTCGGYSNVVWKVSKTGKETVLHSFAGGSDGENPIGGVIIDAKGNLYGTTQQGGIDDDGTVWKVSKGGKETVLYSFTGSDGKYPVGGVIMDAKGNLYGTTQQGGIDDDGTVWKLTP